MNFIDRFEQDLLDAGVLLQRKAAHRRRWRRPALGFGGAIALAACAAAVVLLVSPGGRLSPVQQALAALGAPGEIVHYRVSLTAQLGNLHPPGCVPGDPTEIWQATAGPIRYRQRSHPLVGRHCDTGQLADGTPILGTYEEAYASGIVTTYVPQLRHVLRLSGDTGAEKLGLPLQPGALGLGPSAGAQQDPQLTLRALLASPGLKDVGVSTKDGRSVHTFTLPVPKSTLSPEGGTVTYVVDAATFAPISITSVSQLDVNRLSGPSSKPPRLRTETERVVFPTWERLPLDAAHEQLLSIQVPPGTSKASGTEKQFYGGSKDHQRRATAARYAREARARDHQAG